jgi:hypothetical protein
LFTERSVVRIHPWEPFLCCFEQLRPAPEYLVSPNPFHLARSHCLIREAAVDLFEDSQDMPRFKTGQQAEPFS